MIQKKFIQQYEIIYNKFILNFAGSKFPTSNIGFSKFLGHNHNGKVQAWSKGQWPSAYDCWVIHQKMGFNLEWVLTGEGEAFGERGGDSQKPPTPHIDAALLQQVIELLEEHLQAVKGKLSPPAKATVVSQLYELLVEQEAQAREPIQMMRLVMGALSKAANE